MHLRNRIFCVHDDDPALDESFSQAFLGFPPNLLRDLRNARRRGRGTAVLPSVHQKSNCILHATVRWSKTNLANKNSHELSHQLRACHR